MVIDKICKMTVKGVKLKSERFFLISPGVLESWRKNLSPPPPAGVDRVKVIFSFGNILSISFSCSLLVCAREKLHNVLNRTMHFVLN